MSLHSWAAAGALCALLAAGCGNESGPGAVPALDVASPGVDVPDDTSGVADAGTDVTAADDGPPSDIPLDEDAGPLDCAAMPGAGFCPCKANAECDSGHCIITSSGKRCAAPCADADCPDGWTCETLGGVGPSADTNLFCIHRAVFLCMPCVEAADCAVPGHEGEDQCIARGDQGSFCGIACASPEECPEGYECKTGQCEPQVGECTCAPLHKTLEASTACLGTNEYGSCPGDRFCGPLGLTKCDAQVATEEYCDGEDNDCNGQTDEVGDKPCELTSDFGTCTGTASCVDGETVCDAPEPTEETCDGKDNDCDSQTDEDSPDQDEDGIADCIDQDKDGDGKPNLGDNCPDDPNEDQLDTDLDNLGDACDADDDGDGHIDTKDCDPLDAKVYPGADEICDGKDNDCDTGTDEKACDDENPCTDDICDPLSGCENKFNTNVCTDSNPCTTGDLCDGGKCVGKWVDCDDQNPCTSDVCDPVGGCVSTPNELACSDSNACTVDDQCAGGVCLPGSALGCDDENGCTLDGCDPDEGCTTTPTTAPCDDANDCTVQDTCADSVCAGIPKECDDDDPCTADTCDPDVGGCVFAPSSGATCDDGIDCSSGDTCQDGECVGDMSDCDCETDTDCDKSEDGDLCNGTLYCDKSTDVWTCKVDPETVKTCALTPGLDPSCAKAVCTPSTGACSVEHTTAGETCDDGSACTKEDACTQGLCKGKPIDCDDSNVCTVDSCTPELGCTYDVVPGFKVCDDGNACTKNEICEGGFCTGGKPVTCQDSNPCTDDSCNAGTGCVFAPNTKPCNDDNACTLNDICALGQCTSGGQLDCDDKDACNGVETCDVLTGCKPGVKPSCNDGINCTKDGCSPAIGCTFTPDDTACDDGVVCNGTETCDTDEGCQTTPVDDGTECDDDDPCTEEDACTDGACEGTPKDCDDQNDCTVDLCNDQGICEATPVPGFKACDDGSLCTENDKCQGGFCVGGKTIVCDDENPCTADSCNPDQGCVFTPQEASCNDGNLCTTGDACSEGKCTGTPKSCDDNDPCNGVESCAPESGLCVSSGEPECDDAVACTVDTCVKGVGCKHDADHAACDDGEECTGVEVCDLASGCVSSPLPDGSGCDDGDKCTKLDVCKAGKCAGVTDDCNDDNVCTVDVCDEALGCVSTPVPGFKQCDDGNACTDDDICKDGFCKGLATQCDDQNPCTDDTCDASGGCVSEPNTDACDDGDGCTENDVCKDKQCAGTAVVCDDGDPCTIAEQCVDGSCTSEPMDCSKLDAPCKKGVCDAGTCITEPAPCGPKRVVLLTPSFGLRPAKADRQVRGSAGHGGPTGSAKAAEGAWIHFGLHPFLTK